MPTVHDISDFLDTLAPRALACSWDNNGLLAGWQNREVTKILIALDPFLDTAREAAAFGAELIVTHHPLIFGSWKSVTDGSNTGAAALLLLEHGISAINAHTCLDIAPGGVNDCLAAKLGLSNVTAFGEDNLLRMGTVESQALPDFLAHVKAQLGTPVLRYCDGGKPCRKIAVGGGACASELSYVRSSGCDTFVTADVKYNQFWDAAENGLNLIDAGHFYTENPVCTYLQEKIAAAFPTVQVKLSETHRDCMEFF